MTLLDCKYGWSVYSWQRKLEGQYVQEIRLRFLQEMIYYSIDAFLSLAKIAMSFAKKEHDNDTHWYSVNSAMLSSLLFLAFL